jgi:hypothetical protein
MADYYNFTSTRTTAPDAVGLLTTLRATVAPDVGFFIVDAQHYRLKKAAVWAPAEITAAQNAIDGAAALTPQLAAQRAVDSFPIEYKALVLALIDEINILRAALPTPLAARTPAQAITAIRNKAGTL